MASQGKVAIVTGAGSGIGRSVALAFLKDGYGVALAGRRKDLLEETAKLSGAGARALVVPTGLTKSSALDGRKYDISVGQIDIGNARTPLASRMADGVPQANGEIKPEPLMEVDHVGAAVLHMANLPLETNVQFITIMATKMPFIGRG